MKYNTELQLELLYLVNAKGLNTLHIICKFTCIKVLSDSVANAVECMNNIGI